MQTYTCGKCHRYGTSEEMIIVSGGGFRERYCSWMHAALGCLHHLYARNFPTYWAELVRRADSTLQEAHKYLNTDNPTEDLRP